MCARTNWVPGWQQWFWQDISGKGFGESVLVLAGVLGLQRGECLASPGVILCAAILPWVCFGL